MRQFFVDEKQVKGNTILIEGPDVRHIRNVLRLKRGERIKVVEALSREHEVALREVTPKRVVGDILSTRTSEARLSFCLTLIQGLPKGHKADLVVQKVTELGLFAISFVPCTYSVPRTHGHEELQKKLLRWQRIAQEAAKQSQRREVPMVEYLRSFEDALNSIPKTALTLMAHHEGPRENLRHLLNRYPDHQACFLLVGPEGGFSPEEVAMAQEAGAKLISLGHNILRTETASLIASALILYEKGLLD